MYTAYIGKKALAAALAAVTCFSMSFGVMPLEYVFADEVPSATAEDNSGDDGSEPDTKKTEKAEVKEPETKAPEEKKEEQTPEAKEEKAKPAETEAANDTASDEKKLEKLAKADIGMLTDEELTEGIKLATKLENYQLAIRLRDELKGRKDGE